MLRRVLRPRGSREGDQNRGREFGRQFRGRGARRTLVLRCGNAWRVLSVSFAEEFGLEKVPFPSISHV